MRNSISVGSVLVALLVAGCGGGGSNSGLNSTPTAPSSVSKSTSLLNVTQNDDFAASLQSTSFTVSKTTGQPTSTGANVGTANTTVHYDAATKGYSISTLPFSTSSKLSFTDANKDAANTNLTSYEKTSGSRQETLLLSNPGAGNTNIALTYASYGAWLILDDRADSVDVRVSYFAFGTRTSSADMPRTGTATYSAFLDGTFADTSGYSALGGTASVSTDFGTSKITYQADPVRNGWTNMGSFTGSGTIDSNVGRFDASSSTANGYTFGMNGYFYGPGAAEIGGSFSLVGNGGTGVGAIVGKKN